MPLENILLSSDGKILNINSTLLCQTIFSKEIRWKHLYRYIYISPLRFKVLFSFDFVEKYDVELTREPIQLIKSFCDETYLINWDLLRLEKAQNDSSPYVFLHEL